MRIIRRPSSSTFLLSTLFLAALPCGYLGCGEDRASSDAAMALRESFPAQADRVLASERVFVATEEGFALEGAEGWETWRGGAVILPKAGHDVIRLRGFGGVEVRVREVGAQGEGAIAEQAVAYRRAGRTSFWTVAAGGVEEWLQFEAGTAHAGEAVAAWEVEKATVRQRGEVVDIVDDGGVVRLSVTAPKAYGAGREIGVRLTGKGARIELWVDETNGEAMLVDPLWTPGAAMTAIRSSHSATLLNNGKVLVAGGNATGGGELASCELYTPATNSWAPAGALGTARRDHTATLLQDGRVLIVGGLGSSPNGSWLASAELYNPASNTWSSAGTLSNSIYAHTATLLLDGRVLVAGGNDNGPGIAKAQWYTPASNAWFQATPMSVIRYLHTATRLQSGKVLVVGGYATNGAPTASAEIYDPSTNLWVAAASMGTARVEHTATLLQDGRVLVANGVLKGLGNAEVYDPATNSWAPAGTTSTPRVGGRSLALQDGNVLIAGGYFMNVNNEYIALANAELYDPGTNAWFLAGTMSTPRWSHTATLLPNGVAIATGGNTAVIGANYTASVDLYQRLPLGASCNFPSDCQSGFCADGMCCNTLCNGACDACSVAAGGASNGTCSLLTGPTCNDGNACTQMDTCQAGACVGTNPVTCSASDQCHAAGVCDPATGACSNPAKPDGAACNDGNACTQTDTCQAGSCNGGNAKACAPLDQCHDAGVCDPATGACSSPVKADGTACNDSDGCTQADTCQAGICTGSDPVTCKPLDSCHVAGMCDSATGVCTNPQKPDTASCDDGDACTQTDTCQGGACMGGNPVVCKPLDDCHDIGACDSSTGVCTNPSKPEGADCPGGTCIAGACVPAPDAGGGGSGGTGGGGAGGEAGGASDGSGGGTGAEAGGCGCRTSGTPSPGWLSAGLAFALLARRRRTLARA